MHKGKKKWIIAISIILVIIIVFLLVTSVKPAFVKNLKEKDLVKISFNFTIFEKDDINIVKRGTAIVEDVKELEKIKNIFFEANFRSHGINFFNPPIELLRPIVDGYIFDYCLMWMYYSDGSYEAVSTQTKTNSAISRTERFEFGVFSTPKKEKAFMEKIIDVTNAKELMQGWEVS